MKKLIDISDQHFDTLETIARLKKKRGKRDLKNFIEATLDEIAVKFDTTKTKTNGSNKRNLENQ